MSQRPFLLDATRMVWRRWTGRLPTGIDRVCLAYIRHFAPRAQAVLQRGEHRLVLSPAHSDLLFAMLQRRDRFFRLRMVALFARAAAKGSGAKDLSGRIYLNVGHTGLDAPGLPAWLERTGLIPVYLIHDLIPITHPQFCRAGEAARHVARMRHVLECARGIILNSATTLKDLSAFAAGEDVTMPDNLIAWLGVDEKAGLPSLRPSSRPYFMSIGTIEGRKNHKLLLRVWERLISELGDRAPELVLVGQRGWEADDVFAVLDGRAELKRHIRELNACDDTEMQASLSGARALLMPSFVEGFGIPVIEALQRGTPVIASDIPALREVGMGIPLFLQADDDSAWHAAMLTFLEDGLPRLRQLDAMTAYEAPRWDKHFREVDAWLTRFA